MLTPFVAHVVDAAREISTAGVLWGAVVICFVALLAVEHLIVKHGRLTLSRSRAIVAGVVIISLAAASVPLATAVQAQATPTGLPDLISDPPFIWFSKTVETPDGLARVMAFDGYIHNIGEGRLDVAGNPQVEDGMKQRVFDGTNWNDVGTPTVKFETDDGHNHFHLKEAVAYQLWDEGRTEVIGDASKVGFCLIDTEQMEQNFDAFYTIEDSNYCGVESPDITELNMGISPGWRDTYDANITLQWVDVSNARPGRYWVSAITDPKDEIVESNEDNNGLVFSMNKFAVDGYNARTLLEQTAGEPITLKADVYGVVGERAFVVVDGPRHGSLNVPTGVDLYDDEVVYQPGEGFEGEDSFTYYAHDITSPFPLEPTIVTVDVVGDPGRGGDVDNNDDSSETLELNAQTLVAVASGELYSAVEVALVSDEATIPGNAAFYSSGLPPGLRVDVESGLVTGYPTVVGSYDSQVTIAVGNTASTFEVEWAITDPGLPTLHGTNPLSTTSTEQLRMNLGTGTPGATYEGQGLPKGGLVVENLPLLTGTPEEFGDFDVTIRELVDGDVITEVVVTWSIRPAARPAFAL